MMFNSLNSFDFVNTKFIFSLNYGQEGIIDNNFINQKHDFTNLKYICLKQINDQFSPKLMVLFKNFTI